MGCCPAKPEVSDTEHRVVVEGLAGLAGGKENGASWVDTEEIVVGVAEEKYDEAEWADTEETAIGVAEGNEDEADWADTEESTVGACGGKGGEGDRVGSVDTLAVSSPSRGWLVCGLSQYGLP